MPPNEDRSLLNNLNALAHHQPTPDAADRALARTRAVLLQSQSSHHKRRLFMRIAIPSSIAAALIAATLIFFSLQSPRPASAAEQLDAAVQTTKAYKGWIKLTVTAPKGVKTTPMNPPLPASVATYENTDGSRTSENLIDPFGHDGKYEISFWSIPRGEIATYNPSTNEIHLATMMPLQKQQRSTGNTPTNVADALTFFKKEFGHDALAVKESPDGETSRFDITLFSSPDEAQKFAKDHNDAFLGTNISLWVNHEHLISRMRFDVPEGPAFVDYTYNVPDIHDIYDIGAARSAKVIDDRLSQDLQTVMDRLDARVKKTFGNYTALLVTYELDDKNQPSPNFGALSLYAVHDDQWLADQYLLFHILKPGRKERPTFALQSPPPNWPTTDIAKLLPILRDAPPVEYWIMSGNLGWRGFFRDETLDYDTERVPDYQAVVDFQLKNVATNIWPSRINNNIGSPKVHAELLHDKDHTGLFGIHSVRSEKSVFIDGGTTWWLDPARDDMPVEIVGSRIDADGKPVTLYHTTFLEYAQLPNGQWYPTHWRGDETQINAKTGKTTLSTTHYRLQILPNLQLDPSWFQPPHPKTFSPQPLP